MHIKSAKSITFTAAMDQPIGIEINQTNSSNIMVDFYQNYIIIEFDKNINQHFKIYVPYNFVKMVREI